MCRGMWSSGIISLKHHSSPKREKYLWRPSSLTTALQGQYAGGEDGASLSLNLFNAVKICLSGLSGIWQELCLSMASSPLQLREDATPSKHTEKGWGREILKEEDGRAPSDLMAPQATGACDSPSLEAAGHWSLGVPSDLRMEIFLSLSRREMFLANRHRQQYFTAYGALLTPLTLFVGQMSALGQTFTVW